MSNPYTPDRPRSERIIDEIKELSEDLGRVPTANEFDDHGDFTTNHAKSEFGSWTSAKSESGVPEQYPSSRSASPEELINEIQRLYEKLGRTPKVSDLKKHGVYKSSRPYKRVFGTWNAAVQEAGYEPNNTNVKRDQLISELQRIAIKNKEAPQRKDLKRYGNYSITPYSREFGSLSTAINESDIHTILNMLEEVKNVSETIDGVPTITEVVSSGQYDKKEYFSYFNSWQDVIASTEITTEVNTDPYRGELLDELRKLQNKFNRPPRAKDIREISEFDIASYIRVFGSFERAKKIYEYLTPSSRLMIIIQSIKNTSDIFCIPVSNVSMILLFSSACGVNKYL